MASAQEETPASSPGSSPGSSSSFLSSPSPFLTFLSFSLLFATAESSLVAAVSLSSSFTTPAAPAVLYCSFALSATVVPHFLRASPSHSNPDRLLLLSFFSLSSFPLSSLLSLRAPSSAAPAAGLLLLLAAAVSGAAAASLWSLLGPAVAAHYERQSCTRLHPHYREGHYRSLPTHFSAFTSVLLLTTFAFHLLTSFLLDTGDTGDTGDTAPPMPQAALPAFKFLSAASLLASLLFAAHLSLTKTSLLPFPPPPSPFPLTPPSLLSSLLSSSLSTLRLTLSSPPLLALAPAHVASGLAESLLLSVAVSRLPPSSIGYATAVKTAAGAATSAAVACAASDPSDPLDPLDPLSRLPSPTALSFPLFLLVAALTALPSSGYLLVFSVAGAGQALWSTTTSGSAIAKLSSSLPPSDQVRAFAAAKFLSGLSSSVGFALFPLLPAQAAAASGFVALACCAAASVALGRREVEVEEGGGEEGEEREEVELISAG